ncbi:MAG TPA: hypothetical protein VIR30_06085 [Nocardioides sp.]
MNRLRIGVGAAVVLAVVVGLLVWFAPLGGAARPGELFEATFQATGKTARVMLPGDRALDITVGKPERDIERGDQNGYPIDDEKTERGNRIVPVSWRVVNGNRAESLLPRVTLVSDGRRYALPVTEEGEHTLAGARNWFVVVEGKARELSVEVEYDGLVQVMDVEKQEIDAGVAAPLYESPGVAGLLSERACTFEGPDGGGETNEGFSCEIENVLVTPYLPALGWVEEEGSTWIVLDVFDRYPPTFDIRGEGGTYGYYRISGKRSMTLGGAEPVEVLNPETSGGYVRGRYVFLSRGAPEDLALDRTYAGKLVSGDGSPAEEIRFSGSLRTKAPREG